MLHLSRRIGMAELHEGAIFFTRKISPIVRTECQKSFRSYVHQHACAEKNSRTFIFVKDTAGTREKTHLGLILDLSAKDTALELMYINIHVQGNFWN